MLVVSTYFGIGSVIEIEYHFYLILLFFDSVNIWFNCHCETDIHLSFPLTFFNLSYSSIDVYKELFFYTTAKILLLFHVIYGAVIVVCL